MVGRVNYEAPHYAVLSSILLFRPQRPIPKHRPQRPVPKPRPQRPFPKHRPQRPIPKHRHPVFFPPNTQTRRMLHYALCRY
jgi:hypothetical protein